MFSVLWFSLIYTFKKISTYIFLTFIFGILLVITFFGARIFGYKLGDKTYYLSGYSNMFFSSYVSISYYTIYSIMLMFYLAIKISNIFKDGEIDGTTLLIVSRRLTRKEIIFGRFFALLVHILTFAFVIFLSTLIAFSVLHFEKQVISIVFSLFVGTIIIGILYSSIVLLFALIFGKVGTIVISGMIGVLLPVLSLILSSLGKTTNLQDTYKKHENVITHNLESAKVPLISKYSYGSNNVFVNENTNYHIFAWFDLWYQIKGSLSLFSQNADNTYTFKRETKNKDEDLFNKFYLKNLNDNDYSSSADRDKLKKFTWTYDNNSKNSFNDSFGEESPSLLHKNVDDIKEFIKNNQNIIKERTNKLKDVLSNFALLDESVFSEPNFNNYLQNLPEPTSASFNEQEWSMEKLFILNDYLINNKNILDEMRNSLGSSSTLGEKIKLFWTNDKTLYWLKDPNNLSSNNSYVKIFDFASIDHSHINSSSPMWQKYNIKDGIFTDKYHIFSNYDKHTQEQALLIDFSNFNFFDQVLDEHLQAKPHSIYNYFDFKNFKTTFSGLQVTNFNDLGSFVDKNNDKWIIQNNDKSFDVMIKKSFISLGFRIGFWAFFALALFGISFFLNMRKDFK